jgi:hypothetical protein
MGFDSPRAHDAIHCGETGSVVAMWRLLELAVYAVVEGNF